MGEGLMDAPGWGDEVQELKTRVAALETFHGEVIYLLRAIGGLLADRDLLTSTEAATARI